MQGKFSYGPTNQRTDWQANSRSWIGIPESRGCRSGLVGLGWLVDPNEVSDRIKILWTDNCKCWIVSNFNQFKCKFKLESFHQMTANAVTLQKRSRILSVPFWDWQSLFCWWAKKQEAPSTTRSDPRPLLISHQVPFSLFRQVRSWTKVLRILSLRSHTMLCGIIEASCFATLKRLEGYHYITKGSQDALDV